MKRLRHPVRAIREPFGTAGLVVACIALVLALTGAAFAAGALTGKQKKEVEKIAKKFAGKPGAAGATGPAGPQGAAGANGKDGSNGTNGTNGTDGTDGTDGESPVGTPFTGTKTVGSVTCTEGGVEYEIESTGESQIVCNGAKGVLQPGETLCTGCEEKGVWSFAVDAATAQVLVPISFPIPVNNNNPPGFGSTLVHFGTDADFATFCEEPGNERVNVVSSAPSHTLCVSGFLHGLAVFKKILKPTAESLGLGRYGAQLELEATGAGFGVGYWAVKG